MIPSFTTTDNPEETKRRRRFSSPFRRSRSRPRSVSATFPSTTLLVSSTSLTATPNDIPDIPKAFQGRPHSYHAPDLGMHPAYRGSTDQLTPTSPSHERGRTNVQASLARSSFVTETEVRDDTVPPVPSIPTGIDNERQGRRSRSWGNAGLMLQSAIRHTRPPAKSSRSLGASPIITQFDVPDRTGEPAPHATEVSPRGPWNDDEHGKNDSPRTRHSSPITKGLWMGDTSPVLSKRTPTKADETEDDGFHQPVLPKDTDGTLAPADLVQLSKHHDEPIDTPPKKLSKKLEGEILFDTTKQSPTKSPSCLVEGSQIPGPGTLLSTTKSNDSSNDRVGVKEEAPLPQEFVMQLSGEISPLLHSSKASLREVSDDEGEVLSPAGAGLTGDQIEQRLKWETEVIGGDVSDDEENVLGLRDQRQSNLSHTVVTDKDDEQAGRKAQTFGATTIFDEDDRPLKSSSPEAGSSHMITRIRQSNQANYETKTIGVGNVSPTSDHAGPSSTRRASTQALAMQSALESKVIGTGDVSPVSTRSSVLVASPSKVFKDNDREIEHVEEPTTSSIERFYTAGVSFDLEPARSKPLESDAGEDVGERPRIERFETAQEGVQGSSELTIPKVRHPASRYATVLASEPVVSYKEYTGSSSSSSVDMLEAIIPQAPSGALTPQRAERADMPQAATRRVSASQLQVVHAVEEYAASNSSLASWDQDSNAADAISEPGAVVEMMDESDLVTPVAQVPRNAAHHGQQADQAGNFKNNSSYAASNGYFNEQSVSDSVHQGQQNPVSTSNMTVPERSKSLLSIISSAVSSTPISPASSNAGRSTPSTIHRMQRDFSNAKRTNLMEVQIPEEPTSAKDDQTPTARHEDYDLYADHNGVVKDVRDNNGQPLRLASTSSAAPTQLARTTTGASSIATAPDVQDSPGRRYSFERPMSFISGPQDDDGRPQDQINQPLAGSIAAPPIPPQSKRRSQQYPRTTSGAIYSNFEPVQDTHWPPGEVTSQPPVQSVQPPVHEPAPAKVVRQPTRFVPHTHEDEDEDEEPAQQTPNLPPQRTPPSIPSERLVADGQPPPNGIPQDQHAQDPRVAQNPNIQCRSVSAPLQRISMPGHDPRVISQPLGSPPAGPSMGPRNEFEYQQQMMQLQAKYPRFRGAESQALNVQQPSPTQQGFQAHEKSSSKPRLAAAMKGIVGGTSPNAPNVSNAPLAPSSLAPTAPPTEASRAESFVSAVSSMSREPTTSTPGGQPGIVAGPQSPPSLGAESHYSHVSQGSTQVQPAQSRHDLTMPAIPAQYQSFHPQQQQHSQLAPPQQSGQSQGYRASTSAIPDAGKKKRFSAFTGLFGKGTAAAELQGKFKMSREEKKAQKAQRHTSQPVLQSPPTKQWPPPNMQFIAPQQPNNPPGQGLPPAGHAAQAVDPRFMPSHGAPHLHPQGASGMHQPQGLPQTHAQPQLQPQMQQGYPPQQQRPIAQPDEGSAYLRTKQMAEEHQARQTAGQPPRPVYGNPTSVGSVPRPSSEQPHQPARQSFQRPPPSNGYYYPEKPPPEQGAYMSSQEEQQQRALQLRQQQQLEAERRLNGGLPPSPGEQGAYGASAASRQQAQQQQRPPSMEQGAYGASQVARQQALQQRQKPGFEQGAYGATHEERQRLQQQGNYPLPGPEAFGRSQIHYDQIQQHGPPQRTHVPPQHERQQIPQNHHQPAMTREEHMKQAEHELAQHRWQQQQTQLRESHLQQQAQLAQQQAANRSVSGPLLNQASPPASPVGQRHVSSPVVEPQYDTPPIPGAYGHVQGVFVSPLDQPHAYTTPHDQFRRQESDPHMQPISPQVSAPNARHHSDASSVSVVSPISGPTPEPSATGQAADQRLQKPRMPSISEVHQQAPPQERPWHMNFPAGTTEQDIVRARQKQFFQQQFASQQQAQAERHASSPSPRVSPDKQSPPFSAPFQQSQEQGGGFREVLPRKSPQPYAAPQSAPLDRRSPRSSQQTPSHPNESAGWPLHSSPGLAGPQPPTNEPHTPRHPEDFDQRPSHVEDPRHTAYDHRRYEPTPPNESQRVPPPNQQPQYDENVPDEAPPSYDGPGVPNDGMEKSNPDRPRPPNIITAPTDRGRQQDGRPRQASLGLMQHPQPASMAASPQRTAPDMGAESLRRQMLQQEEHARMERIQRSQMQAVQRQREQQERDAARARAQELERSVSGGGRVGSLRSVRGSHNGGTPGWERRGLQGGSSRPVFELPAVEDEEPVMRATSFPGQEWVPPMYVDD
ncbi:hypothetical protein BU25DRAFT_104662 [Macroventuria anomochaeta]|uniref:Uncharacterized protein n=1 Tax=Macroventuria anomochaeta TaxID=301207 RepID=A0ACB6RWP7_9PLEO|nr:uncharacterized protein BU25DRAFT_104662 [Macroventuria anomochaeta]KAF2625840.1 hypothetical protein BU25DRAFT_104662 [Macroventuria anomochaeta]